MKQTGKICYKFKGMNMHPEPATVLTQHANILTVNRNFDNKPLQFINTKNGWLHKDGNNADSLLCGTSFVFE